MAPPAPPGTTPLQIPFGFFLPPSSTTTQSQWKVWKFGGTNSNFGGHNLSPSSLIELLVNWSVKIWGRGWGKVPGSAGPTTPCRLTESPSFGNPLPILSLSLSVTAQGGETSCQTLVYWTQITRHHRLLNFDIAFLVPFLNPEDINRKSDICNIWQIILEIGFLINHLEEEMKRIFVLCQYMHA